MQLQTERLLLRNIVTEDYNDIYEYASNPNVGPSAGWKPHASREETIVVMRDEFLGRKDIFGMVLKDNGKMIGTIGLMTDAKRNYEEVKMLGYSIGEPYWGNGYTTEAAIAVLRHGFKKRRLDVISAYCYPFNARSRRVLEKCGFVYEGILRNAERLYDGSVWDNLCFSMMKHEFRFMK